MGVGAGVAGNDSTGSSDCRSASGGTPLNDERDELRLLNYQSPIRRDPRRASRWLRSLNRGEDTFLASSALLFALLCWATTVFGWALGAPGLFACAGAVM